MCTISIWNKVCMFKDTMILRIRKKLGKFFLFVNTHEEVNRRGFEGNVKGTEVIWQRSSLFGEFASCQRGSNRKSFTFRLNRGKPNHYIYRIFTRKSISARICAHRNKWNANFLWNSIRNKPAVRFHMIPFSNKFFLSRLDIEFECSMNTMQIT